ncbi:MAG: DUF5305 domain-containing protein [Anaerolineales bacterium]|nr:DUF5305 domain-containing protein [Anaerolineales bacterium]
MLWGYVIMPVEWYDAAVYHLRPDLQEEYLRMAVDSNTLRSDPQLANKRFKDLGDLGPETLLKLQANPGLQGVENINKFNVDANAGIAPVSPVVEATTPAQEGAEAPAGETTTETQAPMPTQGTTPQAGTEEEEKETSPLLKLFLAMCGITLVVGIALAVIYLLRSRRIAETEGSQAPLQRAKESARQARYAEYTAAGEEPPMAQFMASYKVGDDLFDDSFSIDSPTGEFMGECGVGISETIGVGEPKKVTAFEVWLFDKNDIQTVTKVLMSAHAFRDEALKQRLAAKGEPLLAEPAGQALLETATLRLVAKVVDMNYGEGALPDKSFFDNMILEIAIWQK